MLKFVDNYPLKNITTLQIGGPAKKFVTVKTQDELIEAVQFAKQNNLSYLIIGGGSNLLVADEGVDSLVIKNEITSISTWEESKPTSQVSVKSGTPLQTLVDHTIQHGLSGLEKLTGIPGTVGGAVYGNAGAYGQTISDYLTSIVILGNPDLMGTTPESGKKDPGRASLARMTVFKEKCCFNYRDSIFKKNRDIILEVHFQLESGNREELEQEEEEILAKRLVKYPPGIKCPGSFFKNLVASDIPTEILKNIPPEKIVYGKLPAGALLEEVGAKGQKLDGIYIADYHANLFINTGQGTAWAFYKLAKKYAQKVKEKFGITLEPEVQLINLPPII